MKSYIHIYNEMKEKIIRGDLKAGAKLPAHRGLCEDYSVAIATVTKAINRLKREGWVESYRGLGTIVANPARKGSQPVTKTVTFISPYYDALHETLSYAIQKVFAGSDWSVNTRCAHADLEWYGEFLKDCRKNPPAGMVLVTMDPREFRYDPEMLPQPCTKTVLLVHEIPGKTYDIVRTDAYFEGVMLGEYLLDKGYRDCLYLTGAKPGAKPESNTIRGLAKVFSGKGLKFGDDNIRRFEDTHSYGPHPDPVVDAHRFAEQLLSKEHPRAIIAGHDWTAVGVIRAAQELGLSIPEDIAVISAEGSGKIESIASIPKLTTVDTLFNYRGTVAAETLKRRLEGDDRPAQYHEIHTRIIEGKTG